ncbi:hypothetical protein WME89_00780 [Sorangium sp. So ce321]|uniref:hypothetical protein n=1 Tax=Sorangium sp. So ce321 TaxID=3133300 RepID=UPI003F5E96C9
MTLINGIETHALCTDTPPSSPLGSVRLIPAQDEPGACSPIARTSHVDGAIEGGETRVFCCTQARFMDGN